MLTSVAMEPFGVRIQAEHAGQHPRDVPVDGLRELARGHGLVLLRGFARCSSAEELSAWCAGWGQTSEVLDVVEDGGVPLHWDGTFEPYVPEFQILSCVSATGEAHSGWTTFCDTTRLLAGAATDLIERWRAVSVTYRIPHGRGTVSPLVVPHPVSGVPTIRYHEPPDEDDHDILAWPSQQFDGIDAEAVPEFLGELHKALHNPQHLYTHVWQQGDIVIADNHALLHGRENLTDRALRHLCQVHVLGRPVTTDAGGHRDQRKDR